MTSWTRRDPERLRDLSQDTGPDEKSLIALCSSVPLYTTLLFSAPPLVHPVSVSELPARAGLSQKDSWSPWGKEESSAPPFLTYLFLLQTVPLACGPRAETLPCLAPSPWLWRSLGREEGGRSVGGMSVHSCGGVGVSGECEREETQKCVTAWVDRQESRLRNNE